MTINKNNLSPDNVIFVFDRAYYSEDFINYLDLNKYNYVIRAKKSSLYINIKENKEKILKKRKKINNENVRFVKHEHKYKFNKKNKNNYLAKHNQSLMINGLKIIIPNIINANLTKELLFKL